MTERDEILRLLETGKRSCIAEAIGRLRTWTLESELSLRMAEDLAITRRALGDMAQVSFELAATGDGQTSGCYSVGFGSKHPHTFDVAGRGASLDDAIAAARANAGVRRR